MSPFREFITYAKRKNKVSFEVQEEEAQEDSSKEFTRGRTKNFSKSNKKKFKSQNTRIAQHRVTNPMAKLKNGIVIEEL